MAPARQPKLGLLSVAAVLVLSLCAGAASGWSQDDQQSTAGAATGHGAVAPLVDAGAAAGDAAPGHGACGLACCDQQVDIIEQLLGHLEAAKQQNTQLRDGLLRTKHHTPVLLVNPLGGPGNTAWQVATLVATLLCLSALAREARAKRQVRQLQQALREKEAAWRRCVDFLARSAKQCGLAAAQSLRSGAWNDQVCSSWQPRLVLLATCADFEPQPGLSLPIRNAANENCPSLHVMPPTAPPSLPTWCAGGRREAAAACTVLRGRGRALRRRQKGARAP